MGAVMGLDNRETDFAAVLAKVIALRFKPGQLRVLEEMRHHQGKTLSKASEAISQKLGVDKSTVRRTLHAFVRARLLHDANLGNGYRSLVFSVECTYLVENRLVGGENGERPRTNGEVAP